MNTTATKESFPLPSVGEPKSKDCRQKNVKMIIIGIIGIIVSGLIISGFVLAFYFMHETSSEALKVKHLRFTENGQIMDETIDKYSDDVFKYTVSKSDRTFSVVEDFNRRVVAIRRTGNGLEYCLVLPLTTTDKQPMIGKMENNTQHIDFSIDLHTIVNHDLLGPEAREMCRGYPLHWGITGNHSVHTGTRQKRHAVMYCYGCDCYSCYYCYYSYPSTCYCDDCHWHRK